MGRCAHVERIDQESELLLGLLRSKPNAVQHLTLQGGVVNTQGAPSQFQAVENQVVGLGASCGKGFGPVFSLITQVGGVWGTEGMVQGFEPIFVRVEFEHREIDDPQKIPLIVLPVGLYETHLFGEILAHAIESFVHRCGVSSAKEEKGSGLSPGALQQGLLLLV